MNQSQIIESPVPVPVDRFIQLGDVDYVVIVGMLLVSASIGLYFRFSGGKQKTTREFLLAGRDMSVFPVTFSIMASGISAITYLGVPSDMYVFGTHFAFINLGNIAGALAAGYIMLPVFFSTDTCTTYEYLEKRFGRTLRVICSFSFSLQVILYIAVVLYAPALALSAVTSLSIWTSVVSVGVVCTFYCTLGGMKAVLWTDVFQAILMYGGIFTIVAKGTQDAGGFETVLSRSSDGGRLVVPGLEMDFTTRYTLQNTFLYGFVTTLSAYGASQMQVQRLLTVKSLQRARLALFSSIPITFLFQLVNCFAGLVIYANFYRCDPLSPEQKVISKKDQLLPYFTLLSLGKYPGVAGFCICGMLSAALSTMSSMVNSLTTVTVEDFIRPLFSERGMTETKTTFTAKFITLGYGAIGLLLTYVIANFGDVLQASTIVYGLVAGPTLGVFLLGVLTSRTNEKGAIVGLLVSLVLTAWISVGGSSTNIAHPTLPVSTLGCVVNRSALAAASTVHVSTTPAYASSTSAVVTEIVSEDYVFPLYKISYMWFSPIGTFVTLFLGYVFSFAFGKPSQVDDYLLNPVTGKCLEKNGKAKECHKQVELKTIKLNVIGEAP